MTNKELTVTLVNSILQILDEVGQGRTSRRQCRPCHHGWRGVPVHQQEPGVTLDREWHHRTEEDPREGPSRQAPADAHNPRVRVLERPPSPSPDPPAYWPMELSDPGTSLRSHWDTPCTIHGWGSCPKPAASRRLNLSSH
jgi:hypothetical protein